MPVRQRLLRLVPALTFLLLNLFLALSLGGYDPADAPGSGAEPANHSPLLSNPCGPVGATLAHVSFNVLGWSSWLLLLGLVAVNVLVVARRKVADRVGPCAWALRPGAGLDSAGMIHKFAPWASGPVPRWAAVDTPVAARGDLPVQPFWPVRHASHHGFGRGLWPGALPRRALHLAGPGILDLGAVPARPSPRRQGPGGAGRARASCCPPLRARRSRRCRPRPIRRLAPPSPPRPTS